MLIHHYLLFPIFSGSQKIRFDFLWCKNMLSQKSKT
nr:MAG TPA_asm: hypothetical protein [Caudoviricetes sp.]